MFGKLFHCTAAETLAQRAVIGRITLFFTAFSARHFSSLPSAGGKDVTSGFAVLCLAGTLLLKACESGQKQSRRAKVINLTNLRQYHYCTSFFVIANQESEEYFMKIQIKITEKLVRVVSIPADSVEEAKQKAEEDYKAGNIVLTADDFVSYSITRG